MMVVLLLALGAASTVAESPNSQHPDDVFFWPGSDGQWIMNSSALANLDPELLAQVFLRFSARAGLNPRNSMPPLENSVATLLRTSGCANPQRVSSSAGSFSQEWADQDFRICSWLFEPTEALGSNAGVTLSVMATAPKPEHEMFFYNGNSAAAPLIHKYSGAELKDLNVSVCSTGIYKHLWELLLVFCHVVTRVPRRRSSGVCVAVAVRRNERATMDQCKPLEDVFAALHMGGCEVRCLASCCRNLLEWQ